jgi:AcrR family transcriptional regulator
VGTSYRMSTPDEASPMPPYTGDDTGEIRERQREDSRARIVAGAQDRYLCGQRVELTTLAAEHGVSRATAYRWFGDNERLLAEVLGERVRDNFLARILEHADKSGPARVLAVVEGVLRYSARSKPLEALLWREPNRVLKILASSAHDIQGMEVQLLETLLTDEHAAGHLQLPVPARTLAYGIIRLMEAYLYADVMAGEPRDIDNAVRMVALLMPEPQSRQ